MVLAVNTLLMQLFTLFSYIMDGFAYAGEALTGKYIGARNYTELRRTVNRLFGWGITLAIAFTLLYSIGGKGFLGLLTNDQAVIEASTEYFYWVLCIPLADSLLSCSMEFASEPPLPTTCCGQWPLLQLPFSLLTMGFRSNGTITHCGWPSSFTSYCGEAYRPGWDERL